MSTIACTVASPSESADIRSVGRFCRIMVISGIQALFVPITIHVCNDERKLLVNQDYLITREWLNKPDWVIEEGLVRHGGMDVTRLRSMIRGVDRVRSIIARWAVEGRLDEHCGKVHGCNELRFPMRWMSQMLMAGNYRLLTLKRLRIEDVLDARYRRWAA